MSMFRGARGDSLIRALASFSIPRECRGVFGVLAWGIRTFPGGLALGIHILIAASTHTGITRNLDSDT